MCRLALCVVVLASLLPACTASNPLYTPSGDADLGDLAQSLNDLAGQSTDLSRADLGMPPPPTCSGDQRACGTMSSLFCQNGMFAIDRACPNNSSCNAGYCQPPPLSASGIGMSCVFSGSPTEALCLSNGGAGSPTCAPFVSATGDPKWVCVKPTGSGTPGTTCSSGSSCRSGFCGSNGTCFRACTSNNDCPSVQGPGSFSCTAVQILVEGKQLTAKSCVP